MKAKELDKSVMVFLFAFPVVLKQYLVKQARFHATFDFLNSRFFETISVSLGGLKNRDFTVQSARTFTAFHKTCKETKGKTESQCIFCFDFDYFKHLNIQRKFQQKNIFV